jgi:type II secretory pathway component PulM
MKFALPKIRFLSRLSPREKMIVAGGGLAAVLFFTINYFVFPAYDVVSKYPEQIQGKTEILKKYKKVISQRDAWAQSLETAQKHVSELETHLLNAGSSAAAQAQLQGFVLDLAKQSQLQVSRSDFIPKKELSKDYEKISVRFDAVGTVNQITAFLIAAKTLPIFVFNDETRIMNYSGGNNESFKKVKQISTTIVVSGVIRHE